MPKQTASDSYVGFMRNDNAKGEHYVLHDPSRVIFKTSAVSTGETPMMRISMIILPIVKDLQYIIYL